MAFILPLSTVATLVLLLLHVIVLFVAFEGVTVAVNDPDPPTFNDNESLFNVTLVTLTVDELEVTVNVAFVTTPDSP